MNPNKFLLMAILSLSIYFSVYAQSTETQKIGNLAGIVDSSNLGYAVALSVSLLVVGAPENDKDAGHFYVFSKKESSDWQQVGNVIAPPWGDLGLDAFGYNVDIDGDQVIVGSYGANLGFQGRAAIWTVDTAKDTIIFDSILEQPSGDSFIFGFYGFDVSVSGNYAIAGAPNSGANGGSAYIFTRSDTSAGWDFDKKISASDAYSGENFGRSVAISGGNIIVGTGGIFSPIDSSGAVYFFQKNNNEWTELKKFTADTPTVGDQFGWSVDIDSDYAIVGAPNDGNKGAAYIFHWNGSSWEKETRIIPQDGVAGDLFGESVSISGTTICVSAFGNNDSTGVCYVYSKSSNGWEQSAKIISSDINAGDGFGKNVAISSDWIACGAPFNDDGAIDAGAVYLFEKSSVVSVEDKSPESIPIEFNLSQNYPNPFNPSTTIEFSIPQQSFVTLKVYDLLGREVRTLVSEDLQTGSYKTEFSGINLTSGTYFYRLVVDGFTQTNKFMLIK
jgi:FG-GAP repeat/Secretion system C-terminal sorting domain